MVVKTIEGSGPVRILIIDDEPAMHDSYRQCFVAKNDGALNAMAADLFGDDDHPPKATDAAPDFALTHAMQGLDGVNEVERALAEGNPFAVAFIDIRMPPGIDGRETAKRIRALDPDIKYGDRHWLFGLFAHRNRQGCWTRRQDFLHRQAV